MSKKTKARLVLTDSNYYTHENQYITNSKIGDFLKAPDYFYQKDVLGIIKQEKTEPLIIGSAVDCILTEGWDSFKKRFVAVDRRNIKDPPKDYTELTQRQYDEVIHMGERIMSQSAFKELAGFETQKILQVDMPLGNFYGIAGKPDWFKVFPHEKFAIIRDLKTSSTIDPVKYYYHALKLGYYRQQAMYQMLVAKIYKVKTFISEHLVMEKDPDGIYKCQTFVLDQVLIDREKQNLCLILDTLKHETEFRAHDTSFKEPIRLSRPPMKGEEDELEPVI